MLFTLVQATPAAAMGSRNAVPPLPLAAPGGVGTPFTGITAIAATGGHAPLYVANATGLYRAAAPPYAGWTRQSTEGAIVALSANPSAGDDLVCATQDGEITHSLDGGKSGTITASGLHVMTLARAGSDPSTIYAGGSDGQSGYIYRSSDDGVTWSTVYTARPYSLGSTAINDLAVDPQNPEHLFAAESIYHGGAVIESDDGGHSWQALPAPSDVALEAPSSVLLQPGSPSILWAAWSVMGYGQLESSADGGHTWRAAALSSSIAGSLSSMSPDSVHGRLYIDVQSTAVGHPPMLLMTQDGGKHFPGSPAARRAGRRPGTSDRRWLPCDRRPLHTASDHALATYRPRGDAYSPVCGGCATDPCRGHGDGRLSRWQPICHERPERQL